MRAAQTIRDLSAENPSSSTVGLQTGGGKIKTVGTKPKETDPISAEDFHEIMQANNMSMNQGESVAKGLRRATKNRKLFEKGLMEEIRAKHHELDDFYTWTDMECVSSKKDESPLPNGKVVRPAFHIKKEYLMVLINTIFERRGWHHNTENI